MRAVCQEPEVEPLGRRDGGWAVMLAAATAAGLAISWQRWGNPLIDGGREMNEPLRLLRGEALYTDVRHLYGPLAPHVNASLYRLFGPSLDVLYAAGAVSTAATLALVYRIARSFIAAAPAAAATAIVLWTCALSPFGSWIFPYAYAATYGMLFALASLALVLAYVERDETRWLLAAGVAAGLAAAAKTEPALVACGSGLVTALAAGRGDVGRSAALAARFLLPAAAVAAAVYAPVVARVGADRLLHETFVLPLPWTVPAEHVHFDRLVAGLDRPAANAALMLLGSVRLALAGGFIAAVAALVARFGRGLSWIAVAAAAALVFRFARTAPALHWIHWGQGLYRGLPVVLGAVLAAAALEWRRGVGDGEVRPRSLARLALATFALASLGRILLRVEVDTVYAATCLPASLVVLAWLAVACARALAPDAADKRIADAVVTALLLGYAGWTAAAAFRIYRLDDLALIETPRGRMFSPPELAAAFNGAIAFVGAETRPGEPVAVVPEGTSIDFLADRRNPLREEAIHPGILDADGEASAIERLATSGTRVVLVTNRRSSEFGRGCFGVDYAVRLFRWIEANFEPVATFGRRVPEASRPCDAMFFIRAYRRRASSSAGAT